MIKAIALIKRKPGLSREEFVKHYEEVHAVLARKHFPTLKRYVRNHVTTVVAPPGDEEPPFDCITEECFDDMEGLQAVFDFWMSEAGKVIRDDEDSFMDTSKLVFLLVEEKVSE